MRALHPRVDGLKMVALAGSIASALIGTLYAAADADRAAEAAPTVAVAPLPEPAIDPGPALQPIPEGADPTREAVALLEAQPGEIVDPETGVIMGPLTILRRPEPEPEPAPAPEPRATRRARHLPRMARTRL
ncbi:MAG: hypothetical protein R3B82_15720 [Sandaracinaceae bacterium]